MLGSWIGVSEACVYRAVKTFRGPSFAYHSIVFGPPSQHCAYAAWSYYQPHQRRRKVNAKCAKSINERQT